MYNQLWVAICDFFEHQAAMATIFVEIFSTSLERDVENFQGRCELKKIKCKTNCNLLNFVVTCKYFLLYRTFLYVIVLEYTTIVKTR